MLSEILKLIPREEVKKIISHHKGDYCTKSFRSWDHLIAMITGQLSGAISLRELAVTLNSHPECHYHLHTKEVKRSTLSDANNNRNFVVFRDIASLLVSKLSSQRKALDNVVTVLDSSLISLRSRGHEWANQSKSGLSNKGLKLHVQFNHTEDHIEYVSINPASINDVTIAQSIPLMSNRVYVFDKGYCDYNWWKALADNGNTFVTRLKKNASFKVKDINPIAKEDKGFIIKDQVIVLSNKHPRAKKVNILAGIPLRLIEIKHPNGKEEPFMIVTNTLDASAQRIAGWYKERWSIELLFKWLKQNLKIKRFMGESHNAIMIQLFVAIISYVLLKFYQKMIQTHVRLKDVGVLVKTHLFTRPKLPERKRERRCLQLQSCQQLTFGFYS